MTNPTLTLGQQVTNFGVTATVVDFHPVTGDPTLYAPGIGKWLADAAKCESADTALRQKTGLVTFG